MPISGGRCEPRRGRLTIAGVSGTTIDAGKLDRIFTVPASQVATISNISLTNGQTSTQGSGIYNAGTLILANDDISNNDVLGTAGSNGDGGGHISYPPSKGGNGGSGSNAFGGAIYSAGGTVDIEQSRLYSSTALGGLGGNAGGGGEATASSGAAGGQGGAGGQGQGGTIAILGGAVTISNSNFENNQATGGKGGYGGDGGGGLGGTKPPGTSGTGGAGGDGRGGDVFLSGGTLSLTNCTLTGDLNGSTYTPQYGANGGLGGTGGGSYTRNGGTGGQGGSGLGGSIYVGAGTLDLSSSTLAEPTTSPIPMSMAPSPAWAIILSASRTAPPASALPAICWVLPPVRSIPCSDPSRPTAGCLTRCH